MIWNESIECMDRESLRKIQSIRLKKTVERVYHDTPFYRKKMQELGVTPDDINSIDDIVKLPFTTKYDLRDNYPFGLCAVPMSQIVRIHASSGTITLSAARSGVIVCVRSASASERVMVSSRSNSSKHSLPANRDSHIR